MSTDPEADLPTPPAPAPPPPPPPTPAPSPAPAFTEAAAEDAIPPEILNQRICDFGLRIEGRPLERVVDSFRAELRACGITRLTPRFYLSDEWGVPEETVAIGIPFYLADERLLRVQELRAGVVEGMTEGDILRYLRHEMGHVVNYAYRLYAAEEWTRLFGPMARPYPDEYRTVPFSPDYVRHLPGGYAQRHPDEDWAETFAVWMTPGSDWRALYGDAPGALAKLEYCARTVADVCARDPDVTSTELDNEVSELRLTVQEFYEEIQVGATSIPRSLDGDLRAIFAAPAPAGSAAPAPETAARPGSAAALLRRQRDFLANVVYHWTGVDDDLVRQLLRHLIHRAHEMRLTYPVGKRDELLVEMAGFLTTLAMNYVYKGHFIAK